MWASARVRKDSVTSPLFQLALVTTSLVIFCQCIYLALCIIRDFFRPQHCCEAVNYSIQYVSPPSFSPAFEINSLKWSFTLPSLHHHLSLVKPGNGFSSSLAEVPPAMGILMFTLLWSLPLFDVASWVGNAHGQTRKYILILRGTTCLWIPQGTICEDGAPQALTLFFWQGSHLLHEDQGESTQSRGWGGSRADRARLLLVLISPRDSVLLLCSTTWELQSVEPLSCEARMAWPPKTL